jgi:beta-phosphoglucomutase-like phosphatase (HAD superfamily)
LGVLPTECVGIEDAPAGIIAIKSAMMKSIGVGSAVDPSQCDRYVKDTSSLTSDFVLFSNIK